MSSSRRMATPIHYSAVGAGMVISPCDNSKDAVDRMVVSMDKLLPMVNEVLLSVAEDFSSVPVVITRKGLIRVRLAPKVSIMIKHVSENNLIVFVRNDGACMCREGIPHITNVGYKSAAAAVDKLLNALDNCGGAESLSNVAISVRIENINKVRMLIGDTQESSYYYNIEPIQFNKPHCAELAAAGRAFFDDLVI